MRSASRHVRNLLPHISVKNTNAIDYIVGGVFIYTLTNYLLLFYLPQFVWWFLDLIAVSFYVYGISIAGLRMHVDIDTAICSIFLLVYATFIFVLGVVDPLFNIPHIITNQHYVLPFLFPLLVFIRLSPRDLQKIYSYLYLGCFIAFVYYLFNAYSFIFETQATHEIMNDAIDDSGFGGIYFQIAKIGVGFPFVFAIALYYISNHYKYPIQRYVVVAVILACMLSAMAFGRRSNSAYTLFLLVSPFLAKSFYGKHKMKHIMLIISFVIVFYFSFFIIIEQFPILESRWDSDSRSQLFSDFFKKSDSFNLIFGKGLHGTYVTSQDDLGVRDMIENGHLDIILRTGIVYLIPYMYIIFSAFIKGIVRTRSWLITGAAIYLLIKFLMMFFHIQIFDLSDMMLFFCISLCCSSTSTKSYRFFNRNFVNLLHK